MSICEAVLGLLAFSAACLLHSINKELIERVEKLEARVTEVEESHV